MPIPPSADISVKLQSLSDQLDQSEHARDKEIALVKYLQAHLEADKDHTTLKLLPSALGTPDGDGRGETRESTILSDIIRKHNLGQAYLDWVFTYLQPTAADNKPLERLPCANVKAEENWGCRNDGKLTCGECHLVSYCSKECQRTHWRVHKRDCKDPIRSPTWQPAWIREMRDPTYVTSSTEWKIPQKEAQFALGLHIWGNIPAFDTLNLPKNEGASGNLPNLSLAYVASGDLRNVVRTVNELPDDYSGELTIVLNDREPMIVLRNMLLLMILGTMTDEIGIAQAADVALHLWGSTFIRGEDQIVHAKAIMQLTGLIRGQDLFSLRLGENSIMAGKMTAQVVGVLAQAMKFDLDVNDANAEIRRVRFEPTREDRHHRGYCRLKPSHRLASLEFRRFGIVLPFGAANNHFNTPNKYLFSSSGRWLQDDLATPLESWNIEDVIAAGKAHGAQSSDLYGCLYFYFSGQLRSFAERIRKFKISFRMFNQDARELAKNIQSGTYTSQGLPKNTTFDRIDVSNIIDAEYLGISNVLAEFSPLLNKANQCATIIGYSMNWVPKQHNSGPGPAEVGKLMRQLIQMGKGSR